MLEGIYGIAIFTLNHSNKTIQLLTIFSKTAIYNPIFGWININNSERFIGDFNGDGKTDLAYQSKTYMSDDWVFLISNGINFVVNRTPVGLIYEEPIRNLLIYDSIGPSTLDPELDSLGKNYYVKKTLFIVKDFNNDGKTDIVRQEQIIFNSRFIRSSVYCPFRNPANPPEPGCFYPNTQLSDWTFDSSLTPAQISYENIKLSSNTSFNNNNIQFTTQTLAGIGFNYLNSISLNTNIIYNNKFNLNSTLTNGTNIYSYALARNHSNDMLLKKITTSNGVTETIDYKPLKKENLTTPDTPNAYNIYKPINGIENYPNIDLNVAQGLMVVSKLEKQSKNTTKKQLFAYCGAVTNTQGLGFLGFRSTMRTDWYDDETKIFSNITLNDISRRGAPTRSYKVEGFVLPSLNYNPTVFVSKSENTYNTPADALQTNKVLKLKNTKTETWNTINNTSSETNIVPDIYNNPTSTITHVRNGTVIEKTTTNTIVYDNQPTATTFIIGRPTSKIVNTKIYPGQANEDISINEEQYAYTNHLLTQIKKRATNSAIQTSFLTEDNIFDPFGNIRRKTITAVGETPRITNFEYDPVYGSRFLTKSIDTELLETLYTYDPATGLVLTELMPSISGYPLLTTNTYDSWGKKIKVKNYLNKEINYAYTRDVEKTLITATSDDGSSTIELYDDIGRKIKTGTKTIDGTWAYTENEYDNFDRTIKVSEPYFDGATKLWNETTFDNLGRPTQIKSATGKIAIYTYGTYPNNLTTNVNDGVINKTNIKNALGNVISLTDSPGGTITYSYFANGNLKQSVFGGATTTIEQDGWGRKTKLVEPSAGEYNYTYNGFGQALTETTPNGTTTYNYTNIGKLNTKWVKGLTSPDGTFSGTNILSTYNYYNLPNKKNT